MTSPVPAAPAKIVQCGWCPVILPYDYVSWYLHFAEDHRVNGCYSVRHIQGTDWDMSELEPAS